MSRARATALALVNWKGVFYERYLLDRHVTALEGSNGAGKTTVMIAAYVVLLPDLSRLRFTNVGESGATGGDKGIWGRLGELGRPSYAALELRGSDGEAYVAGVQLERGAEPSIELSPFLVSGVKLDGRLKELLLVSDGDNDAVPELADVRANVEKLGGRIEVFSSTKEYFGALFERGITPLRLATDEDRNKMNEMLRTSMTGGISRALTSELRNFLLKEQTGLADTLGRMRANLDACHRTRTEIREARHLEHEINGIYEAGQAMFAAGLLGTRVQAGELERSVLQARVTRDRVLLEERELEALALERAARATPLAEQVRATRDAYDRAVEMRAQVERARQVAERLEVLDAQLQGATDNANAAALIRQGAAEEREACRKERDRARDGWERAAHGLGDLQSGLEELHRRAHAHRAARLALENVRSLLSDASFEPPGLERVLPGVRKRRAELDAERARRDRAQRLAEVRAEERRRVREALQRLAPGAETHEDARRVLSQFNEVAASAARAEDLAAELHRVRALETRQRNARERAARLGLAISGPDPRTAVESEVGKLEANIRELDRGAQAAELAALDAERRLGELREQLPLYEARAARRSGSERLLARLASFAGRAPTSREELVALRGALGEEREKRRTELAEKQRLRETRLDEAQGLETGSGLFDPDLLRLRDEVDGELLAGRFEDLDPDEAARLEAELGELAQALIVDDPDAAADALAARRRDLPDVWLVKPGTSLRRSVRWVEGDGGAHAIVTDERATRITRMPERPVIGRRARERRSEELFAEARALDGEIEAVLVRLRQLEGALRDVDELLADPEAFTSEDPVVLVLELKERIESESTRMLGERERTRASQEEAAALRPHLESLRSLLGEAQFLVPPQYDERVRELAAEHAQAEAARAELARTRDDRRVLSELSDVLREPPTSELDAHSTDELEAERDRLFKTEEALGWLLEHRDALGWGDAEKALGERSALAPTLEAQNAEARRAFDDSETRLAAAEGAWEAATLALQKAEAEREAVAAQVSVLREELNQLAVLDPSEAGLANAVEAVSRLDSQRQFMEIEERNLGAELALARERRERARERVAQADEALDALGKSAEPARAAWQELERRADEAGLLRTGITQRFLTTHAGRRSNELFPEAWSKGELLLDRLETARGGQDAAAEVRTIVERGEGEPGARYLDAWLIVRDWLRRRLPAQVSEVEEPLEALERLRDHLALLEQRVQRQESDLRGASEDVARGIEVQLRKAKAQVRRLNQNLDGVRFGSIAGIRVQMRRVERMDQVLAALREGAVQELLFQPNLPIEDALDEIFRRYGGGRTGGQKLLDYREYAELTVEILRQSATEWEPASPTRLSTGEAIGVGAALMMVILTEWERDANLLRPKRSGGSLRFLFLDEANRLSRDNLGVLFDLCENLDLQLLIAAPEVARAEGNTTYRLVRRLTDEGREEVIVSGRRSVAELGDPGELPSAEDTEVAQEAGPTEPAVEPVAADETPAETGDRIEPSVPAPAAAQSEFGFVLKE
jgi:chromosome partition protein MukB